MCDASKIGICALCHKPNVELQESHYFPKAIYKKYNSLAKNDSGIVLVKENTKRKLSVQLKQYLLCKTCENRLKRGEDYFLEISNLNNKKKHQENIEKLYEFILNSNPELKKEDISDEEITKINFKYPEANKLLDNTQPILLKSFVEFYKTNNDLSTSDMLANIDNDLLYYFIVSIFWRSSFKWNEAEKIEYPERVIKEMKEYLIDPQKKPKSFHITIIPIFDLCYSSMFVVPLKNGSYMFLINNFVFYLVVGDNKDNYMTYKIHNELTRKLKNYIVETFKKAKVMGKEPIDITW